MGFLTNVGLHQANPIPNSPEYVAAQQAGRVGYNPLTQSFYGSDGGIWDSYQRMGGLNLTPAQQKAVGYTPPALPAPLAALMNGGFTPFMHILSPQMTSPAAPAAVGAIGQTPPVPTFRGVNVGRARNAGVPSGVNIGALIQGLSSGAFGTNGGATK